MLIVLDLDDTLYLERNYVRSGFLAVDSWVSRKCGVVGFYQKAWDLFENGARGNIFDMVLRQFDFFSKELVNELVHIYRHHTPDIALAPDAEDFLNHYEIGRFSLISDGYSVSQWRKIHVLGLDKHISKIIVTDDRGRDFWKPNPWAYLAIQGKLSPDSCIYISDNPLKDFEVPFKLKWKPSVRIRREGSLHFEVPTPEHCLEVESFDQILEILD